MLTFLVTASGTDIGKTFVTAGLVRAWRAAGRRVAAIKPVMSGVDPGALDRSDAGVLLAALGTAITRDSVSAIAPWCFAEPISPDMAAARAAVTIDFDALLQFCRHPPSQAPDILLIEAVGGVMTPITPTRTVLDWAAALDQPAILVGGTHLGAISHLLTAHLALRSRPVPVAGVVLSESPDNPVPPAETHATIARHLPGTLVVSVGRSAGSAGDIARLAASLLHG